VQAAHDRDRDDEDHRRPANPEGEDIRGTFGRDRRSWSATPELGYGRT